MRAIVLIATILVAMIVMYFVGTMPTVWFFMSIGAAIILGMSIWLKISGDRQWGRIAKEYERIQKTCESLQQVEDRRNAKDG